MIPGNKLLKSRVPDEHGGLNRSAQHLQRFLPTVPTAKSYCVKQIRLCMSQKQKDKIASVPPRERACLWRKSSVKAVFRAVTAAQ